MLTHLVRDRVEDGIPEREHLIVGPVESLILADPPHCGPQLTSVAGEPEHAAEIAHHVSDAVEA